VFSRCSGKSARRCGRRQWMCCGTGPSGSPGPASRSGKPSTGSVTAASPPDVHPPPGTEPPANSVRGKYLAQAAPGPSGPNHRPGFRTGFPGMTTRKMPGGSTRPTVEGDLQWLGRKRRDETHFRLGHRGRGAASSRVRFVRFASNERAETTFAMLAECFAQLGGVPKVVMADRMGCPKGRGRGQCRGPHPGLCSPRLSLPGSARFLRGE
jgi:hypothetical protein